jgi:MFS transporter, ACS family, solute carrier family 17 (sodium-dependent inorganic phosphate cotransporter), member 5
VNIYPKGILTPAIYAMLAHWIPTQERGVVLALIQVGGNLGAVLALPVSGFLCKHGFAGGWPSVFYVSGLCGILIFILWMYCIYDTPEQHPRISNRELLFISEHVSVSKLTGKSRTKTVVPWIKILQSLPMWSIAVAKFCGAWGNLMLMAKLPTYLESVLHISIEMVVMTF